MYVQIHITVSFLGTIYTLTTIVGRLTSPPLDAGPIGMYYQVHRNGAPIHPGELSAIHVRPINIGELIALRELAIQGDSSSQRRMLDQTSLLIDREVLDPNSSSAQFGDQENITLVLTPCNRIFIIDVCLPFLFNLYMQFRMDGTLSWTLVKSLIDDLIDIRKGIQADNVSICPVGPFNLLEYYLDVIQTQANTISTLRHQVLRVSSMSEDLFPVSD